MQGYVFDILNALDGVFAKHGALINEKYPPCPVCGREGLESYDICTVCGWECDEYDEDEFSFANGTTLKNYRNTYFMLREGLNKLKSGEIEKMFFITCFTRLESGEEIPESRTFGFYSDFKSCEKALNANYMDMCEGYYFCACVEEIDEGIHPHVESKAWFLWDEEKKGFYRTEEKPDWSSGWVNFALG